VGKLLKRKETIVVSVTAYDLRWVHAILTWTCKDVSAFPGHIAYDGG